MKPNLFPICTLLLLLFENYVNPALKAELEKIGWVVRVI